MANEFKIKKGLIVTGASGGTVVDIQGSQGQLFSVTDDLSGSIFAVSDISGVPILDVNSSGLSTFDGDVNLPDNKKILLGTGNDLEIYHDGSNSYIRDQGTGNLIITGSQLTFSNEADTEYMVKMVQNGTVELYYDGSKKLETTSSGVSVSGGLTVSGTNSFLIESNNTAATFNLNSSARGFDFINNNGTLLNLDSAGNGTFADQAFATTATSSGDASSTLTTKGYVDGLITGATIYRGAWDPSGGGYGSPDLSGVIQTSGYYYICSAAGTAEPNGTGTEPDTWAVGDWVIYNDVSGTGQWQKIDNSSVLSGVGTGQTVALWEGAGSVTDSETLGNAPITVSGNNTTFAGTGNFGGSVNIASGGDLILTASSGSTDTGDIVFYHTAAEAHRLWSGVNTLNYRTDGGTTYQLLHSGNYTDYNTYTTLTATTQSAGDDTTNVATTEFVTDAVATGVGNYLPLSAGSGFPLTGDLIVSASGNTNLILQNPGGSGNSLLWWKDSSGGNDWYFGQTAENGNLNLYNYTSSLTQVQFKTNGVVDFGETIAVQGTGDSYFQGNVGVGTTSPTHLLNLSESDSNSVQLVIDNTNTTDAGTETSEIRFRHYRSYVAGQNDAGEIIVGKEQAWDAAGDRNSYMAFGTRKGSDAVVEKMRITSGGNVGIGVIPADRNVLDIRSDDTNGVFVTHRNNDGFFLNRTYGDYDNDGNTVEYQERIGVDGNRSSIGNFSNHTLGIRTNNQDRITVLAGGNVGINNTNPEAKLDVQPDSGNGKVLRVGKYTVSTYYYTTQADATIDLTCGSYYQAEVIITANQTNGGDYNNIYIRGIWSNNHTTHHWDEIESIGFLTGSSIGITVGQNTVSNSGKLSIDFNYTSASFSILNIKVTDFYGTHSYSIS